MTTCDHFPARPRLYILQSWIVQVKIDKSATITVNVSQKPRNVTVHRTVMTAVMSSTAR